MYNRRSRRCPCACNNENCNNDMLESSCQSECYNCPNTNDSCGCGFDEENIFPQDPMLGQSYVPIQYINKTFIPSVGLKMGTIFPELVSPYTPGQSMQEIAYIENANTIREGCNG